MPICSPASGLKRADTSRIKKGVDKGNHVVKADFKAVRYLRLPEPRQVRHNASDRATDDASDVIPYRTGVGYAMQKQRGRPLA
jgi:hypothetical protein